MLQPEILSWVVRLQAKRIDGTSVAAGTYPEKRGLVSSQ